MIATIGEAHDLGWKLMACCGFEKQSRIPPSQPSASRRYSARRSRGRAGGGGEGGHVRLV